ncbi:MAG: lipopolysaccharide biosynthesis protein [Sphingomonas sp.]|nr:lipopolysaccharide biosynthesis protein [Sphingomonas sp.]
MSAVATAIRNWVKDRHFRLLLKNSGYLAGSQVVAALAGIVTVAFAGRSLGIVMFGMLVLINSYAQAVSGFSKFQSWQLVVRYGAPAIARGDLATFKRATGFALGLDIVSGVAGMIIGIALLPLVAQGVGISDSYIGGAILYCTLLPMMAAATPTGVLRTLQRFDLVSWQGTSTPIARAILVAIAWATHASFQVFLLIWYVTALAGDCFLWFLAWRELQRRGLLSGLRPALRPSNLDGGWRFAINVNLNTTLLTVSGPVARLIVGSLLGPAGAALYRAASSLADAVRKPADLLLKAYYPQITTMNFRSKTPWKLMVRTASLTGAAALIAGLLLVLFGQDIITAVFGETFAPAYSPLLVLLLVPIIGMISFPITPMLYALDRSEAPLRARVVGTVLYLLLIFPLSARFGLIGAAAAAAAGYAISVGITAMSLASEHRRLRAAKQIKKAAGCP